MDGGRTDGQLLWAGMSNASPEVLAAALALLEETSFSAVAGARIKTWWNKEGDEFARQLGKAAQQLKHLPRHDLLLRLLGRLSDVCELEAPLYVSVRDLEDHCGAVLQRALAYQRKADPGFHGRGLRDLMARVMQRLLDDLGKQFEDLSQAEQTQVIERLEGFIRDLPEAQQAELRRALGAEEMSAAALSKAMRTGALGAAFAAVVQVSGFAFYTTAVSALAGLAGLFGLTLPFAAYTTLTSAVAVLTGPLFLGLALIAGGAWLWIRGGRQMTEGVVPLVIVQLAAAGAMPPEANPASVTTDVLRAWHQAVMALVEAKNSESGLRAHRGQLEAELASLKERATDVARRLVALQKEVDRGWDAITALTGDRASAIAGGDWGPAAALAGIDLPAAQARVREIQARTARDGFWNGIRDSAAKAADLWAAEAACDRIAGLIVERLRSSQVTDAAVRDATLGNRLAEIQVRQEQIEPLKVEHLATLGEIKRYDQAIAFVKQEISTAETAVRRAAARYPHLDAAVRRAGAKTAGNPLPIVPGDDRLNSVLALPLVPAGLRERLRQMLPGGNADAAFAGLTIGDFLYDYARIDPTVIEAADFARAADLGSAFDFAVFAARHAELAVAAQKGSVSQLQGYVAERLVAQHLSAAGHDVSFPGTSNQEGWDLLVDGQPFQVKCVSGAGPIREHLERNPHIPVIVNAERAHDVGHVAGVYVDPDLSVEQVRALTEEGLAHGAELADFELPWSSLAVASAVEARRLLTGEVQLDAAVVNVVSGVTGRVVGGTAGKYAGGIVGALLFGPAGFIIGGLAGTVSGGIGGGRLARHSRWWLAREEAEAVREATRNLAARAASLVPEKLTAWRAKQVEIARRAASDSGDRAQLRRYVLARLEDDIRYFESRGADLERLAADASGGGKPLDAAQRVLSLTRRAGIHPHGLQAEIQKLITACRRLVERLGQLRLDGGAATRERGPT